MSLLDWIVLFITLTGVILYGLSKSSGQKNLETYFLNSRSMPWYIVLFSIMGTQASAITFLSAPGQAYTDGMRFVQYYFGLPIAMIVICIFFLPAYQQMRVYTAYELLEKRFDHKTRLLTSFLFLLQRGLSTGISIYAPSLILSSILGWNIQLTNCIMGGLLIIYTVSGGVKAISYTQTQQLIIIFLGMFLTGYMVVHLLPADMGFGDALRLAAASGKLDVITTGFENGKGFDWNDKYNLFSGCIGGFFLALSYFGTDQSQVGRYLAAGNIHESRKGLLMNGFVKIPMQFLILLCGCLVFSFYVVYQAPLHFNSALLEQTRQGPQGARIASIEDEYLHVRAQQQESAALMLAAERADNAREISQQRQQLKELERQSIALRKEAAATMKSAAPLSDTNDTNYIFLHFVVEHLPKGVVGLLIAVIFLAAWGSIAAALNSLASTCMIDWHEKLRPAQRDDRRKLWLSRMYTLAWGLFSILVAMVAGELGSLIEAVNILGSLFYGTILGIFCVALFQKSTGGSAVFYAALLTEALVIGIYASGIISFLWLNLIGCAGVLLFGYIFRQLGHRNAAAIPT